MSTARALLISMRPRQWTKNLIVFAPLIFADRMGDATSILRALAAFGVFCIISGAVYLGNDLVDIERDRAHERKRLRPIAAGALKPGIAATAAALLAATAIACGFLLGTAFGVLVVGFALLQAAYSLWLKNEVILDAMSISAGFVVRAYAGAAVIGVSTSPWLISSAALLALFLGLAKRRHELVLLEGGAHTHRKTLEHYSASLIDSMLSTVTAATVVTYALYTFFSSTGRENQYLMLTVPFVIYGLFRYLYLVHKKNLGGSPEEILLTDTPLIIAIALWLVCAFVALYLT